MTDDDLTARVAEIRARQVSRPFGDARDFAYVLRRLWRPRLCNVCWRPLWFVTAFVRLNPYAAVQIRCKNCGKELV